jgi:hypothetical protein
MSKESLTLEKTMKNNEIPKIQQVEAALTESKVFFSLSLTFFPM